MRCRFGELVREVKIKIDRKNNPYKYYVAGHHMDTDELSILRKGTFATDDVGPAFIRLFKPGQVLYGSRRTYLRKVAVADFEGVTANTTFVLETKDENIFTQKLLPFVMQSERFTQHSILHSKGSTNPYVLFSDLCDFEFELPPLDKQRELADVLWSIEDTRTAYQELAAAAEELVKSRFVEMFGDLINHPEVCSNIEDICTLFVDGDWIESKDQSDEGIRLIQTGNIGNAKYLDKGEKARYITTDTFDRLNCTEVKANDILISRLPAPVGRACIIPEGLGKCITAVDCTIVRLHSEVLPEYFVAYTLSPFYMMQVETRETGSTRKRISRKNLGTLKIPVPSIAEQENFVSVMQQADKLKFDKIERSSSCLMKTIRRKK